MRTWSVAVFFLLELDSLILNPLLFLLVLLVFVDQIASGYNF